MFVGILAYADDIVFIAPTSRAICRILSTCDILAGNFSIVITAKKLCLIIFEPTHKACIVYNSQACVYIGSNVIDIVEDRLIWINDQIYSDLVISDNTKSQLSITLQNHGIIWRLTTLHNNLQTPSPNLARHFFVMMGWLTN